MNPFEPKLLLLFWSTPIYLNAAGTYAPYFGLTSWISGIAESPDPRNGRIAAPCDLIVREWKYLEQFTPGTFFAFTAQLFIENVAAGTMTQIASVTKAVGSRTATARANRLVRKDQELTVRTINPGGSAGAYNAIYTAVCEQVSL